MDCLAGMYGFFHTAEKQERGMTMEEFILNNQWLVLMIVLWTLPWKGAALWKAARRSQKVWFIILLAVNTLGLLEILYIFVFSRGRTHDAAAGTGSPNPGETTDGG